MNEPSDFSSDNPFQSPTVSADVVAEEIGSTERGPMSKSVVVALSATGIYMLIAGLSSLGIFSNRPHLRFLPRDVGHAGFLIDCSS